MQLKIEESQGFCMAFLDEGLCSNENCYGDEPSKGHCCDLVPDHDGDHICGGCGKRWINLYNKDELTS